MIWLGEYSGYPGYKNQSARSYQERVFWRERIFAGITFHKCKSQSVWPHSSLFEEIISVTHGSSQPAWQKE